MPDLHSVLVTGASAGLGVAFARRLAPRARHVVLVARRQERLDVLASELRARHPGLDVLVVPTDLADPSAVDRLVAAVSHLEIDVLVNNAGLGSIGLFEDADPDALHTMVMVNVVGLTRLTRAVLPGMVARGRGGVLNVSSAYGLTWMPGSAAYVGTKHYVTSFTEALRLEVASTGVVVTQVCPGPVDTEFEARAGTFFADHSPPRWIFLSPEQVVDEALRGLGRRQALVIPGRLPRVYVRIGAWAPRALLRLVYGPFARLLRAERERARSRRAA